MTIKELNQLFRKVTLEMLYLPDDETTKKRVRISWPKNGAPDWKIDEDVTFIRVYPSDGQYNRLKDIKYQNNDETSLIRTENYTRIIAVDWILYGPSSFDDADTIRNGLSNNETLVLNKMFLVNDIPAPVRSPELFNGNGGRDHL